VADLGPGAVRIVEVGDGRAIAVFNVEGTYYAIDNRCPHQGGSLGKGPVEGTVVTCPLHRFQIDLRDGICPWNRVLRVKTYRVVVEADQVSVQA
jgi:nitrite reductase (NADH) small subunit